MVNDLGNTDDLELMPTGGGYMVRRDRLMNELIVKGRKAVGPSRRKRLVIKPSAACARLSVIKLHKSRKGPPYGALPVFAKSQAVIRQIRS